MSKKGCLAAAAGSLAALVVLLGVVYLVMDREKKTLSPETRAGLPGQFVTLTDGVTHYQLSGPAGGPVVVLVHGFSVPGYAWERNIPDLEKAGFQVLALDLYGRGYSDRPKVRYDLDLFVRQIDELLTALKMDRPVDIVGISLGGYVTAGFAARHPDRVRRVALLAPQSESVGGDARVRFTTLPGLGEFLFTTYLGPVYMAGSPDQFKAYMLSSDWHDRFLDTMQYAGFRNALLSTLRDMQGDPFDEYRQLGKQGRPVLLLWGDQDQTIPIASAKQVMNAIPQAEFHIVPGAGHESCYEMPEIVDPLLVQFLTK